AIASELQRLVRARSAKRNVRVRSRSDRHAEILLGTTGELALEHGRRLELDRRFGLVGRDLRGAESAAVAGHNREGIGQIAAQAAGGEAAALVGGEGEEHSTETPRGATDERGGRRTAARLQHRAGEALHVVLAEVDQVL